MSDLEQLLRDERDLRVRELAARPDAAQPRAVLGATRTAVRRRRRVRAVSVTCAAALVVAGVGVGAWAMTNDPPVPLLPITSPTPTPSVTPSPSLSPTPTPSPAPSVTLSGPQPLTEAVAAQIGKGWVVGTREVDGVRHAAAISPEGVIYRGPDIPHEVGISGWMYERGFAATVSVSPEISDPGFVDAQTGEVTTLHETLDYREDLRQAFGVERLPQDHAGRHPDPHFVGQAEDGTILWSGLMYYGALVGFATETVEGGIEGLSVNDQWTPGESQGESYHTVILDSEAQELYVATYDSETLLGRWLVDLAANTYSPVELTDDLPEDCWVQDEMAERALAVTCFHDDETLDHWWLPLDGSPRVPAQARANLPTTDDWLYYSLVP